MDAIALAGSLLGAAGEVAQLAAQAIVAARAGDDAKALELLDQALARQQAASAAALVELDAVRARVQKAIDDRFPTG